MKFFETQSLWWPRKSITYVISSLPNLLMDLEDQSRFSNAQSPKLQESLAAATFSSLGISAPLQAALKNMSIRLPTEVQAACIPPLLEGKRADYIFVVQSLYILMPLLLKVEIALGMRKQGQAKRWRLLCQSSRNSL